MINIELYEKLIKPLVTETFDDDPSFETIYRANEKQFHITIKDLNNNWNLRIVDLTYGGSGIHFRILKDSVVKKEYTLIGGSLGDFITLSKIADTSKWNWKFSIQQSYPHDGYKLKDANMEELKPMVLDILEEFFVK